MSMRTHNARGPLDAPIGLVEDTEFSIHMRTAVAVLSMIGMVASVLLVIVGGFTALDAGASGSRGAMLFWGCAAIFLPVLPAGACGAAFASLSRVSAGLRLGSHVTLLVATLAMVGLALLGLAWHNEAGAADGGWKGFERFLATLLGVMLPGLIAVLCGGQMLALLGVKRIGQP